MTLEQLGAKILEIVRACGPRRRSLLLVLGGRYGFTPEATEMVLAELVTLGRLRPENHKRGGLVYRLRLDRRGAARAAKKIHSSRATKAFVEAGKLLSSGSPRKRKTGARR